jgi:hypothetical protein
MKECATCHNDFGGIAKSFCINSMAGAGQPATSVKALNEQKKNFLLLIPKYYKKFLTK